MSARVKNKLQGRERKSAAGSIFNPRTILLLILLGVFSFSAYFVLAGFSGDLKSGNNGGSHALSKSAVGYAGVLNLLKQGGNDVTVSRSEELFDGDEFSLRIVSMNARPSAVTLDELKLNSPTLIVLPKWDTSRLPRQKGWVQKKNTPFSDTYDKDYIETLLSTVVEDVSVERSGIENNKVIIKPSIFIGNENEINFYNFEKIQTIGGGSYEPLIFSDFGIILGRVRSSEIYVLSDPDFLNTRAMSKPDLVEFAYSLLMALEDETGSYGFVFDLSLHGYSRSQNLIKLALTPPFLGASFCLLAMGFLIAWQAYVRFGSPARAQRDIALGKLSLIYNAAGFIKRAGRENKMAADYAKLTRKLVADEMHIPGGLGDKELGERLDVYSKHAKADVNWSQLQAESQRPSNAEELMQNAIKLYKWRGDITHGRK
jgi:hypothetical protein